MHPFPNLHLTHTSRLSDLSTGQKPPRVNFPEEKPSVFEAFTIWLYQGTISRSSPEGNFSYLFLCQLYRFAMAFGVPLLRNTIINIVFAKLHRDAPSVPYDITPFLAQHLRDTASRNLVLDVVLNCGEMDKVQEWNISLAKGFFKCSAFIEDGVVPFGMRSDMRGYLRQLKDHVCGMYHEHPTGDKTKRDAGEVVFFFDPAV